MEEYIKILEERITTLKRHIKYYEESDCKTDIYHQLVEECRALENLLTRYKEYDNLLGEIDSKEASDALYMLWHCALINKEFETQKQQFQIVNAYIKQLEEENKNMREEYLVNNPGMAKYLNDNYIFKSKIESKIKVLETLQKEFPNNEELRIKIIAYKELLGR